MKVAVILRQVPDVVEELVIAEDGKHLSEDDVMYTTNEWDDHALEQALILKERHGHRVTAIAVGGSEAKDALATTIAKGADEAIFVPVEFQARGDNHKLAALLAPMLRDGGYNIVMTGMQAADQIDGGLGSILASHLKLPSAGGITSVGVTPGGGLLLKKEYPGGRIGVMEIAVPAFIDIQSAEQPPRYVPVSKVMQARKTMQVKEMKLAVPDITGTRITQLMKPEAGARAKMLEGDEEKVAAGIATILKERGLL